MPISSAQLREILIATLSELPKHADELRQLDAALGDGDLGITVGGGSVAVVNALQELAVDACADELLLSAGKAFSVANPSTFAALIGGGLMAAAKTVPGKATLDRADLLGIGRAIAGRVAERGKSALGDKTVLDALIPSLDVLASVEGQDALAAMTEVAQQQVNATAKLQSKKGRAAWVQERSVGHPDPGATAYLRFLQELSKVVAS